MSFFLFHFENFFQNVLFSCIGSNYRAKRVKKEKNCGSVFAMEYSYTHANCVVEYC